MGSSITTVKGSWAVPTVDCTETPNTKSAAWVGIDGYLTKPGTPFEQTGTTANCTGTQASYGYFIEEYPQQYSCQGLTVLPGDQISAEIDYSSSTSTFSLSIQDISRWPHACKKNVSVQASPLATAEWIAEAPSVNHVIQALADFGSVTFTSCYADNMPISGFSNVPITMVAKSGAVDAVPSALSQNGAGFSVSTYIEFLAGTGGLYSGTVPINANRAGSIIGTYSDPGGVAHGFTCPAECQSLNPKTFDVPPAGKAYTQGTLALSVNAAATSAGYISDATSQYHGFVRTSGGVATIIDVCPLPGPGCPLGEQLNLDLGTALSATNDAGNLSGMWRDTNRQVHGFVCSGAASCNGAGITSFDAVSGDQATEPAGINSNGDVTGLYIDSNGVSHGFVRTSAGAITTFDATGGRRDLRCEHQYGRRRHGDLGGRQRGGSWLRVSRRLRESEPHQLRLPGAGGAQCCLVTKHNTFTQGTVAFGINTTGDIAGVYSDPSRVLHGFVRRASNGQIDYPINAPGAGAAMLTGTGGIGINDLGYVVGTFIDSSDALHGFVHFVP